VREPELAQDGGPVEVHALARAALAIEDEERGHAAAKVPARWRERSEWAEMRAQQVELHHHHPVVDVAQRDELVALIGKGRARLGEVPAHLALAVKTSPVAMIS